MLVTVRQGWAKYGLFLGPTWPKRVGQPELWYVGWS